MYASIMARLPVWAKPIFWLVALPFRILAWMLKEMGSQAKSGAKKVFAPLLWPVVGIGVLLIVAAVAGPDTAGQLLFLAVALVALPYGLWKMVSAPFSSKKKKKK